MGDERQTGDMAKVAELMWHIRVALLTTVDLEGHFHTRPVQTLQVEPGEAVWFFTDGSSPKVDEVLHDRRGVEKGVGSGVEIVAERFDLHVRRQFR